MKRINLYVKTVFVMLMPIAGQCAYPTVEEAQMLFTTELMNATNVLMTGTYEDFRSRLSQPASMETRCAVESIVIDAVTSIVVRVSTNVVDDSIGTGIIENRGEYFNAIGYSLTSFTTNAVECVRLAEYIGSIRNADFPSDLTRSRVFALNMRFTTNQCEQGQWRLQEEPSHKERKRKIAETRTLQLRVQDANRAVCQYKRNLFSLCGQSVAGCRQIMSDEEFAVFTNEIVTVSHASDDEQRILFRQIR